jgi:hypothetical protein
LVIELIDKRENGFSFGKGEPKCQIK